MRLAPECEASRTRDRARTRLAVLSAPGNGQKASVEMGQGGGTCCELHEGKLEGLL